MGAHSMSAEVIERSPDQVATLWLVSCKCRAKWIGPTYEAAEDNWRQHVHERTGTVVKPQGDKTIERWSA